MKCPKCNNEARAIDTVHNIEENETYRAKKCVKCGHVIYTVEYEVIQNQRFAEEWADAHRIREKQKRERNRQT